jgi:hypothetical protein
VRAQLADQSCSVPRRARSQPSLLQQHDVFFTEGAEVIGDTATHDAAADDDDARR